MQKILDYMATNGFNAKDLQEELRFRKISNSELRESGYTKDPIADGKFAGYSTNVLEDALQTLIEGAYEIEMAERQYYHWRKRN